MTKYKKERPECPWDGDKWGMEAVPTTVGHYLAQILDTVDQLMDVVDGKLRGPILLQDWDEELCDIRKYVRSAWDLVPDETNISTHHTICINCSETLFPPYEKSHMQSQTGKADATTTGDEK